MAWAAATLWPPLPVTLVVWPPLREAGGWISDWRTLSLVGGALAVPAIMALIDRERVREGTPATRAAVLTRFVLWGFLAICAVHLFSVVVMAVLAPFGPGDIDARLGAVRETLLVRGLLMLPLSLVVGLSYVVWAGLMVGAIAFSAQVPAPRRAHRLFRQAGVNDLSPRLPPPAPPPPPAGPRPETDFERGLRPDWD